MFQLGYGYCLQGHDDPWYQQARLAIHNFAKSPLISSVSISSNSLWNIWMNIVLDFLVNAFPVLVYVPDWFPGAGWKRTAKAWKAIKEKALDEPYEWVKLQVVSSIVLSIEANRLT
jgi:hypothetical protein